MPVEIAKTGNEEGIVTMQTLADFAQKLSQQHDELQSWRKVAAPYGIHASMARMIANGYEPGKKIRAKLGLPDIATVIVIMGEVPAGTQALGGQWCECGQPFISNHPLRRKCFICAPYRGKKKSNDNAK